LSDFLLNFKIGTMPDVSIIRDTYAGMSEGELLRLASEEGHSLTSEALTLLYREFVRRGMDTEPIASVRTGKYIERNRLERAKDESLRRLFMDSVGRYAHDRMKEGRSREEVAVELARLGMAGEHTVPILSALPDPPEERDGSFGIHRLIVPILIALTLLVLAIAVEAVTMGTVSLISLYVLFKLLSATLHSRDMKYDEATRVARRWKETVERMDREEPKDSV
jgi:hypothetical protein